jgi:hypothetical protein
MMTMSLLSRFTAWLAELDERQGKLENPIARLTGREFYACAAAAMFAIVLVMAIVFRFGVNAGVGSLPYRAAGHATTTSGTSAYAPGVQSDLSQTSAH